MYSIILFLFSLYSNEHSINSLKKELQAKIQIFGSEIVKPIENIKTKKKLSEEEKVNHEILKNNSYYKKKIILKNLFLVEVKDKKIIFRDFDNKQVYYNVTSKNMPSIKTGLKYKVEGLLLVYADILVFEFVKATRVF